MNIELLKAVSDPEKRGCTLVRTIIKLAFRETPPGVASGSQIIDVGIGLVSVDARVAGALPDPAAAGDFPVTGWIYRSRVLVPAEALGTGYVQPVIIQEDLRSQRKLDRADPVLIVDSTTDEGAELTVRIVGIIRMLYKLP